MYQVSAAGYEIRVIYELPTSSFFNQRSAFDISKNLYKVPSTMYHDLSEERFGSEYESILCT